MIHEDRTALSRKYDTLSQAISALEKSINHHKGSHELFKKTLFETKDDEIFRSNCVIAARESIIHRFKYTVPLLINFLRKYCEINYIEQSLDMKSTADTIRICTNNKLLTEEEGQQILKMLKAHSQTPYIYYEEVAVMLEHEIPQYCPVLRSMIDRFANV